MDSNTTATRGYKFDWLTFTIPEEKDKNFKILKWLKYDINFFEECAGRYFFNAGYTLGNFVNVFYNKPDVEREKYAVNKHCYVFSGVGCTDLDGHLESGWLGLFQYLKDQGCKITRVDLALDDFEGKINFDTVEKKLNLEHFRSSKRTTSVLKEKKHSGTNGETIYIGGRRNASGVNGNYFVRFYDKLAEYESKHQLLPSQARTSGVWQRYEIQFNKLKAEQVVEELLKTKDVGKVYSGIMRATIEFLEPTKNKNRKNYQNKNKWRVSPWWENFLQDAEKIQLRHVEQDFSLGSVLSWIRVAVVPTWQVVSEIFAKFGYDLDKVVHDLSADRSKKLQRLSFEAEKMSDFEFYQYLKNFIGEKNEDD